MRRGRKFLLVAITAVCLLCSTLLVACKKAKPSITPPSPPLTISQATVTLDLHEQVQLSVEETGNTSWTSGDNAVCTVDATGLVKSVGVGVTTVTASQGDKYATCTVTVSNGRFAPQIEVKDNGSSVGGQMIRAMSDEFTLDASVTYKNGNVAASDVSEFQWSVDDGAVPDLTLSEDKKTATVVCSQYGISAVRIAAVVWGEPISKAIEISVRNTNVSFSSTAWEADEDGVYAASMSAVTENGAATVADLDIVCKDGETDVSSSVQWSASKENVVSVQGGKMTAIAADAVTLTGMYQGNIVTVDVTVNKPQFTLDKQTVSLFGGAGDTLLTNYPTQNEAIAMQKRTVTFDLPSTVVGTVETVNVAYKQVVGGNTDIVTRNILTAVDSDDARKITVRPSFYTFNMGDISAQVVTEKAVYTLPLTVYTMLIDSKEDLDAFRYYTTYQNEWKETATEGVFAPILWDGYFVLGDNITYNDKSTNTHFVNCQNGSNIGSDFAAINRYTSFITCLDMYKFKYDSLKTNRGYDATLNDILCGNCSSTLGDFGFCGIFDGRGYNIEGLFIQNEGETDAWTGDIKNEGGFIGMLTSHTFGSDTVYGTIRNISFTEVVHGENWADSKLYGTGGAFLYSAAHGMRVENVNIHAALRRGSYGMLGADSWHTQLVGDSVLRNVFISVDADRIQYGDNDEKPIIVGHGFNLAAYDNTQLENLYIVVGMWDEGMKTDGSANRWGSSGAGADGTKYGCNIIDGGKENATTPTKACASFTELKEIIDTANNCNSWDSEYWEFASDGDNVGTPVFKQKQ